MIDADTTPPLPAPGIPLLIAVTGDPGSGKTSLLGELAAELSARGNRVEGLLAIARERLDPNRGANRYALRILGVPGELPWAERDESVSPPYTFEPETQQRLRVWADGVAASPGADLLVLDEFGRFEAAGDGLMLLWPTLVTARARIVAISVREGCVKQIEARIGQSFDLRVAADDTEAFGKLRRACADFGEWTQLGLIGGASGGIEMTVGSALHAARIPARGLFMSSLQGAMMTFAGFGLSQPGRVVWVPFVSAGLKALSPAGSRIRPMAAICMQGALFGGSVQILGWNVVGITLGGMLVGAWSALQGIFLQYLLLGENLLQAYDSTVQWVAANWDVSLPSLPVVAGAWALVCAAVAGGVAFAAWKLRAPPAALKKIIERELAEMRSPAGPGKPPRRFASRVRELAHWQFWLPLALVSLVLLAVGHSWERVSWMILQFVAVATVLLTILSFVRPSRWAEKLRRRGWWGPAVAFSGALRNRER